MEGFLVFAALAGSPSDARFEWRTPAQISRSLQPLIQEAYVATDDGALRIEPAADTLEWMLDVPGARQELRIGIGLRGEEDVIGFVAAVPLSLRLRGEEQPAVEVSLLCVRPEWRGKGLTRLLLEELRRRCAAAGMRCAIYTSARPRRVRPLLIAECFHRPLRARELLAAGFFGEPEEGSSASASSSSSTTTSTTTTAASHAALRSAAHAAARLPERPPRRLWRGSRLASPRLDRMSEDDAAECCRLARRHAAAFELAHGYSLDDFRHRFLGRGARSFVLRSAAASSAAEHADGVDGGEEDGGADDGGAAASRVADSRGAIIGFVGFTLLPLRTASRRRPGRRIVQAQLLGIAIAPGARREPPTSPDAISPDATSPDAISLLLGGALHAARRDGAAVFNALAVGDLSPRRLAALGFSRGDGITFVHLESDDGRLVERLLGGGPRMIEPARASWTPLLS